MFDNIGGKLKGLAKVVAVLGIIGSIIYGIVLIAQGNKVSSYSSYLGSTGSAISGIGWVVMIVGSLVSWISSWGLYAFGELVENSETIANWTRKNNIRDIQTNMILQSNSNGGNVGKATHKFRCEKCGNMITDYPCPICKHDEKVNTFENSGKVVTPIVVDGDKVRCPECGQDQRSNRRNCFKCGAVFAQSKIEELKPAEKENICPKCGSKQGKDAMFCRNCGTKLS